MNLHKNQIFQKIYALHFFINLSMTIFSFILPIILYEYTKSALAMSIMRIMDFLPNVLLGMLIGVLVDRINRRYIIIYGNVIRMIISFVFVFLLTNTDFMLWHIYILGFLISTISYTIGSATNAIVPQLFDISLMTEIQAKFALLSTMITIIGPGLLGILLLWMSNSLFLWLFLGCQLCMTIIAFFIEKVPTPISKVKRSLLEDMKEGIVALIGNKSLLLQTWTIFFSNFASSLIIGVLTFYSLDQLHFTKEELGMMLTISAIGGIIGAKIIRPLQKRYTRGQIYTNSMFIEVFVLVLFYFADHWIGLGILLATRTTTITMTNIVYLAIRQETTPNHLLGRVAGTTSMIMKLAVPIGLFIGGIWAESLPIAPIFILSAAFVLFNFILLKKNKFELIV
ncbi:MFS transporter [Cytobacillus sp. Sa5YUA1]|uniref:MFS transporter n=1 Tax=Cytobacillus stercorigallinarum TaxID=2762240 RepID=A0ABR8QP46_9BACI|nr:MFS transporter [Cytobacillus stercorigallinarum]MBD7937288.1 MFS transporter [Cytobacillus stercorigallinarum]